MMAPRLMNLLLCACFVQAELLGQGACKKVYKAFDEAEGIEVAWNEVGASGIKQGPAECRALQARLLHAMQTWSTGPLPCHCLRGLQVHVTDINFAAKAQAEARDRVFSEIKLLKQLKHKSGLHASI